MKEEKPLAKIAITSESDVALVQALEKVNEGNAGGRVTKVDMASWLILRAASILTPGLIEEVRRAYFNQATYLENLVLSLKKSKRNRLTIEEVEKLQEAFKQKSAGLKKSRPDAPGDEAA